MSAGRGSFGLDFKICILRLELGRLKTVSDAFELELKEISEKCILL